MITEGYALIIGCYGGKDEVGERGEEDRPILYTYRRECEKELADVIICEYEKFRSDPMYPNDIPVEEVEIAHYIGYATLEGDTYTYWLNKDHVGGLFTPLFKYNYKTDTYVW